MPEVKKLSLSVIFPAGGDVVARVEYDIQFSTKEAAYNITFRELVAVIGQNAKLDNWLPIASDLRHVPPERDALDDLVRYVSRGTVAPDGALLLHRSWEASVAGPWEHGRPRRGPEHLRPLVYLTPLEITTNVSIGGEVRVDVGG